MTASPRQILPSACAALICAVLFVTYAEHIAPRVVPGGVTSVIVTVSVLLIAGFLAGLSANGSLTGKLIFLIIVPVVHWLYAGSDPAKPFIAYLVATVEIVCLWFGATVGHYSRLRDPRGPRLAAYLAVLLAAILVQYLAELRLSNLAFETRAAVPWILAAAWYVILGALAATALRPWRLSSQISLLILVAVLPHLLFEITHGSDPAYPYIGLFFMVPDLLCIVVGAGIATAITRRMRGEKTRP